MQVRLLKNMPPFKFRRIGIDQISETIKGTGSCLSGGHPTAPLPTSCCVTSADLFDVRARPPLRLPQRSARSSRSCGHLRRGVRWQNRPICQKRSDHTRFGLHFMSWVPSVRFQPLVQIIGAMVAAFSTKISHQFRASGSGVSRCNFVCRQNSSASGVFSSYLADCALRGWHGTGCE